MNEKRIVCVALAFLLLCTGFVSCATPNEGEETADQTVWLGMNNEFPEPQSLDVGENKRVKVILLLGQSNATGCSLRSYLKQGVGEEKYAEYEKGYSSVLINYCLDDHKYTSGGEFVPVDLTNAAGGCFGPEVGMAEVLSEAYAEETVVILKYTMSGYSLHHHWLCDGARGSIYEACLNFVNTYMESLRQSNTMRASALFVGCKGSRTPPISRRRVTTKTKPNLRLTCAPICKTTQRRAASTLLMRVFPTAPTVSLHIPRSTRQRKDFQRTPT